MIKWLIKSTNEVRVETKSDADMLRGQMQKQADDMGCILSKWEEARKTKKEKGEVVDEWYIVKYTFAFNNPKEPDKPLSKVEYQMFEEVDDSWQ